MVEIFLARFRASIARSILERVLSRPSCCWESEAITEGRGSREGKGWAQAVRKNLDPDTGGQHPVTSRANGPAIWIWALQAIDQSRTPRLTTELVEAFLLPVGGSQAARSGQSRQCVWRLGVRVVWRSVTNLDSRSYSQFARRRFLTFFSTLRGPTSGLNSRNWSL